jgi:Gpi18-like mannosyltransferase
MQLPLILFYLLNQLNTSEQVHAKINKGPINAFPLVFFLFQHKHVMVEELLKFFIGKVDAKLFKAVELFIGKVVIEKRQ